MKSTDLRIGNLVYYKVVDELDERKAWDEISVIDWQDLKIIDETENLYKPIPLTEEILLKCGFEVQLIKGSNRYIFRKLINNFDYFYLNKLNSGKFSYGTTEIDFVHEIQNLYKEIAKTELEINL